MLEIDTSADTLDDATERDRARARRVVKYIRHRFPPGPAEANPTPASPLGLRPSTKRLPQKSSYLKLGCMTVVTTLDVNGLTAPEYRAVLDQLGVETHPEPGIYLHLTTPIESGFRIIEVWDEKSGFDRFVETRLVPANEAIGLQRETAITVSPLHNFFGPRLAELPGLVGTLPGAPHSAAAR